PDGQLGVAALSGRQSPERRFDKPGVPRAPGFFYTRPLCRGAHRARGAVRGGGMSGARRLRSISFIFLHENFIL
ncbi:hypothetical protein ACU8YE_24360, partial [Ralstonia sp. VS2407]